MAVTQYALYNPATHVAVPREPTQEILACEGEYNKEQVRRIYTVILKAAAAPPHVVETAKLREEVIGIINLRGFGEAPLAGWVDYDRATARKANAVLKLLGVK